MKLSYFYNIALAHASTKLYNKVRLGPYERSLLGTSHSFHCILVFLVLGRAAKGEQIKWS